VPVNMSLAYPRIAQQTARSWPRGRVVAIESITGIRSPEGLTYRPCTRNLGIARATGASQYGEVHKLKAPSKTSGAAILASYRRF
jgi:hypothetical protein